MPVRIPVAALVVALGLTLGLIALTLSSARPLPAGPRPSSGPAPTAAAAPERPERSERFALAVLHEWDTRRAKAWARGDPAALRRLYMPGSAAGRADAELLRRYRARGLVVRDLGMQVLRTRVLVARRDRLELEVTDRLTHATAVRTGFAPASHSLPADRPSTHELVLRRVHGTWLMARVADAPRSGGG